MQTSGLILDVYDDFNGATIRSLFPSQESIPGFVKEAHVITGEERNHLPDDVFALVLLNGQERLRKYACVDAGNTALSVMYFLEHGHKLPEEAQKVAAANLNVACSWYDLPIKGLEKIALAGWAMRKMVEHPFQTLNVAMNAPDVAHQMSENQKAISDIQHGEGWGSAGSRPISPQEVLEHRMMKSAEIGASIAPLSASSGPSVTPKATIKKTAHLVQGGHVKHPSSEKGVAPDDNIHMTHSEQAEHAPQARVMHPHVSVEGLEAKKHETVKKAARYALGDKYPLDSYAQVKEASAYFDEFGRRLSPSERHEFCLNLLPRAEELNIKVAEAVRHYGGTKLASADHLKMAYDTRVAVLQDISQLDVLGALFEKSAEFEPALFVATLSEFDKAAGLDFLYDKDVPDPYYSCLHKMAADEFSFVSGNDSITEDDLRRLAKIGTKAIKHTFGEEFMVEFQGDPVTIFKSLPLEQKKMIMHMANDNSAPGVALLA